MNIVTDSTGENLLYGKLRVRIASRTIPESKSVYVLAELQNVETKETKSFRTKHCLCEQYFDRLTKTRQKGIHKRIERFIKYCTEGGADYELICSGIKAYDVIPAAITDAAGMLNDFNDLCFSAKRDAQMFSRYDERYSTCL